MVWFWGCCRQNRFHNHLRCCGFSVFHVTVLPLRNVNVFGRKVKNELSVTKTVTTFIKTASAASSKLNTVPGRGSQTLYYVL